VKGNEYEKGADSGTESGRKECPQKKTGEHGDKCEQCKDKTLIRTDVVNRQAYMATTRPKLAAKKRPAPGAIVDSILTVRIPAIVIMKRRVKNEVSALWRFRRDEFIINSCILRVEPFLRQVNSQ
jgi:hypothetical protein